MGGTTKELIEPLGIYDDGLHKRLVEIKHHDEMVEAWEFDPFWNDGPIREQAENAYKSSSLQARVEKGGKLIIPKILYLQPIWAWGNWLTFQIRD